MWHIAGNHNVVFFGPRDNPKDDRYWAERGLICHENATENSYKTITVKDFKERVRAISDMVFNSREDTKAGMMHPDEITRHERFVAQAADLIKQAVAQGEPSNPEARRELVRRAPVSIVVPSSKAVHSF